MILPLVSLPGDFSGVVGTNIIDVQLQTGHVDIPSILGAVQDSGAVDITLEEGEEEAGNILEMQKDKVEDAKCNNRRHQETQTELLSLFPVNDDVVHKQMKDT